MGRRGDRGVRSQRLAGRGHVRPVPGRPHVGLRLVARVLRRLPPGRRAGAGALDPRRPGGHRRPAPGRAVGRSGNAGSLRPCTRAGRGRTAPRRRGIRPRTCAGRPRHPGAGCRARGGHPPPGRGRPDRRQHGGVASAVPTATSVRVVPAKLLEVNRVIVNNQLVRTTGGKVSFTHLIGYAVVKGLQRRPGHERHLRGRRRREGHARGDPPPPRRPRSGRRRGEGRRARRTLLVPVHQDADTLDFRGFVAAYEDLIRKVHTNKIAPDDFAGATVTLTNPGTLGTVQSVPRLMPGQGAHRRRRRPRLPGRVRGRRPAHPRRSGRRQDRDPHLDLRPPDHPGGRVGSVPGPRGRVPDGRARLLRRGLRRPSSVPYEPVAVAARRQRAGDEATRTTLRCKQIHVQTLINMYRVRGHLIAHLDPLDAEPPELHPELDPLHLRADHLGPRPRRS